jgi:hypothetical protein
MVVINVLRIDPATDRADPTLIREHLVKLSLTNAVAAPQVIITRAAVQPRLGLDPASVVTRLAVATVATGLAAVLWKIGKGLYLGAVRTEAVPLRHLAAKLHLSAGPFM